MPKVYRHWMSSWHLRQSTANVLGVKEKLEIIQDDGTTEWRDNLRLLHDPVRPFWTTKPEYRDHLFKKEFEDLLHLDVHYCNDSQLEVAVSEALGIPLGFRPPVLRQLCASPYVYGADIDTQTIIRQMYNKNIPAGHLPKSTIGGLDIEAEPVAMISKTGRINLITFIHEDQIYTTALREFCRIWNTKQTDHRPAIEEDCIRVIMDMIGVLITDNNFHLHFRILDTEIDMIKWIWSKVHQHKTDYIGIWNEGYDLPKILERIEAAGCSPADVLSHPAIPVPYRFAKFTEDQSTIIQHFTDKWHWFSYAGYSQFMDAMCLYARLRKVSGRESSYALDEIANKEIKKKKLHFDAITNHWYIQQYRFLEYIAYNINDVILMILMEHQNNDMSTAANLSGSSTIEHFNRQTVMVRDGAYNYGRHLGRIPASAGPSMLSTFDQLLPKAGGAVLPPNKAVGVGIPATYEYTDTTLVSILTNDLDEQRRPLVWKHTSENPLNCWKLPQAA